MLKEWFSIVNNPKSIHKLVFVIFCTDGLDGNGLQLVAIVSKFSLCIFKKLELLKPDLQFALPVLYEKFHVREKGHIK